jgi:hypothetical protein
MNLRFVLSIIILIAISCSLTNCGGDPKPEPTS